MAQPGRIIILAGAPDAASLTFDDHSLREQYELAFKRFLDDEQEGARDLPDPPPKLSGSFPKWRSIDTGKRNIPNKGDRSDEFNTQFFTTKSPSKKRKANDDDDDPLAFLDHSLDLLESTLASQLLHTAYNDDDTALNTAFLSTTSFNSDISMPTLSPTQITQSAIALPTDLPLTNLKHIPSADHLESLYPQTPTVNLLVAIVALQSPRIVNLRRRQGEMEIREFIIGDETRSGFGVNFWLEPLPEHATLQGHAPRGANHAASYALRDQLDALRVGDVVVISNVALGTWREAVYGQSLPSYGRLGSRTTVAKALPDDEVHPGKGTGLEAKFKKLSEFRERFVGRAIHKGKGAGQRDAGGEEELPPDTQE